MKSVLTVLVVIAFTLVVAALHLAAAQQTPKPISDIKEIAGEWWGEGWTGTGLSQRSFPLTLMIREDGAYEVRSGRKTLGGHITGVIEGKARYKNELGQTGTFILYEEKGRLVLKYMRDDGSSEGELKKR